MPYAAITPHIEGFHTSWLQVMSTGALLSCHGAEPLPPSPWIPTFNFRNILKEEPVELTESFPGQDSSLAFLEKEGRPAVEDKDHEDPFFVDVSKTCEPPPLPENAPKSRFGRTLKPPNFYQA